MGATIVHAIVVGAALVATTAPTKTVRRKLKLPINYLSDEGCKYKKDGAELQFRRRVLEGGRVNIYYSVDSKGNFVEPEQLKMSIQVDGKEGAFNEVVFDLPDPTELMVGQHIAHDLIDAARNSARIHGKTDRRTATLVELIFKRMKEFPIVGLRPSSPLIQHEFSRAEVQKALRLVMAGFARAERSAKQDLR